MKVDLEAFSDGAQQVFIVVDLQIGMHSTLHQNSGSSQTNRLLDLLKDGPQGENIPPFPAGLPVEVAEGAASNTYIGIVDVAVNQKRDNILGMLFPAHGISHLSHLLELP